MHLFPSFLKLQKLVIFFNLELRTDMEHGVLESTCDILFLHSSPVHCYWKSLLTLYIGFRSLSWKSHTAFPSCFALCFSNMGNFYKSMTNPCESFSPFQIKLWESAVSPEKKLDIFWKSNFDCGCYKLTAKW